MSFKIPLNAGLGIAAVFAVAGLLGLNYYDTRHPVVASAQPDRVSEALSRLDECEKKIKSALPEEAFTPVFESISGSGSVIRAERHLRISKDSAELLKRLEDACAPLRTQGSLKTEIEIQKVYDGLMLKLVVSNGG